MPVRPESARSPHTVSAYRRHLLALARHAAEVGLRDWAEIDAWAPARAHHGLPPPRARRPQPAASPVVGPHTRKG
ncbi:MAG: site-specific integrase [Acidobacteria bacterium]|nr:site-specific integrase [Acidobacteriota bacterium]